MKLFNGNPTAGVYFAPSAPNEDRWFWYSDSKPNMPHPICGDTSGSHDSFAVTDMDTRIITMCQYQFDQDLWSASNVEIKTPLLGKATKLDDIDTTIGQTWVHEMFHLIKYCKLVFQLLLLTKRLTKTSARPGGCERKG